MKILDQLMLCIGISIMTGAGAHINFKLGTTWTVPLFAFGILLVNASAMKMLKGHIVDLEKKLSELRASLPE